jgi:hypothetical protein
MKNLIELEIADGVGGLVADKEPCADRVVLQRLHHQETKRD